MRMEFPDHGAVILDSDFQIDTLVHALQGLRVSRLKTDEDMGTARSGRFFQEKVVIGDIDGRLHPPPLVHPPVDHAVKNAHCPLAASLGITDEVVVEKKNVPSLDSRKFFENRFRASLPVCPPEIAGYTAETAVEGTAPGCLHGLPLVAGMQKIPPRRNRTRFQVDDRTFVDAAHPAFFEIPQDRGPDFFDFAGYYGIGVADNLVGEHGSMNAPHHDGTSPAAVFGRNFIGPADTARKSGNSHQVRFGIRAGLEVFVHNTDIPIPGRDRADIGQAQRLETGNFAQYETAAAAHRVYENEALHRPVIIGRKPGLGKEKFPA